MWCRGTAAAIGGRYVATRDGATIVVRDRASGAVVVQRSVADDATQLAVSDRWLVWRTTAHGGGDRLWALPLPVAQAVPATGANGIARLVAGAARRESIDRPALSGDHLAYAATTRGGSAIVIVNLATQRRRRALSVVAGQLSQPSLDGGRLLYVQSSYCSQRLRVVRTSTLRRPARCCASARPRAATRATSPATRRRAASRAAARAARPAARGRSCGRPRSPAATPT